jgi:tetratricopeptide (TPR) repeat protein
LALAKLDLTRAEELIKLANEKSPGQPHFIDTYGWVLFQKGEYSKAMEQYLKAYEVNPNDKIIIEHLGDGYFKAGKVSKAVEYWKKALELESTNKNLKLKIEKQEYYEPIY